MSTDKAEQMFELFSTCKDCSVWWNEKNVHIRSSTILLLQFRGLSFVTFIFASTFGMSPFQALTKFSRGQKTCNTCSNCTQFWWKVKEARGVTITLKWLKSERVEKAGTHLGLRLLEFLHSSDIRLPHVHHPLEEGEVTSYTKWGIISCTEIDLSTLECVHMPLLV